MLNFFRKHQKIFFIFVTAMTVLSFTFFGTYSAFTNDTSVPDRELGKTIEGSSFSEREVAGMVRFLSTSLSDRALIERGRMPNLMNDGVVVQDLLQSGIASLLVEKYFDLLEPDLTTRLRRAKSFRPYQHPQAPFLSAEAIWEHFAPHMKTHLTALKTQPEGATLETFQLLASLYVQQASFPSSLLKRVIAMQQNQYSWLQPDPNLAHEDLSLFGYQTLEEWFGTRFLEIASEWILNIAAVAEQKGYKVSKEEARAELMVNVQRNRHALAQKESLPAGDPATHYKEQLYALGIDESHVIKIWQKVMLMRRLMNEVGDGVLLDPLAYEQFHAFTDETIAVEHYQLPEELKFRSFRDLLKFQLYLDAVSPSGAKQKGHAIALPKQSLSAEEVEKQFPELVERKFLVECAAVKKEELALGVSVKETWEWQLDEQNWAELKKEFPVISSLDEATREGRFSALEKLDDAMRLKADQFARGRIVDVHPEWVDRALLKTEMQKKMISVRLKGGDPLFKGIEDRANLIALLDKGGAELERLTGDGEVYFKIRVLDKSQSKELLTFAAANRDGTLEALLDQRLEEAYSDARRKDSGRFQTDDGSWKSFQDVKDYVGSYIFASVLKAIDEHADNKKSDKKNLEFYAAHRLYGYMKEAKTKLEANPNDSAWVQGIDERREDPYSLTAKNFADQWRLIKVKKEMRRSEQTDQSQEEMFHLPEGSWSAVAVPANGDLSFFQVLHRVEGKERISEEKLKEGQAQLANEARRAFAKELIEKVHQNNGITVR